MLADRRSLAVLRALVAANARFWPAVAPAAHGSLRSWESPAAAIPDPALRALALDKLHTERFNAEVAATLATLAPAHSRSAVTRSIVALELLFDYLDGRTENLPGDPFAEGLRLFAPFVDAVRPPSAAVAGAVEDAPADWGYLQALSSCTRDIVSSLPSADALYPVLLEAATRCAEAQTRIHAVPALGSSQLEVWATARTASAGLGWREYACGSASSVLAAHALISAAACTGCTPAEARKIDAAYLAIAAVITILDSVVDAAEDAARGETGFLALFADAGELEDRLRALIQEAISRAWEAPHGPHHAMTLAGVAAYYTTHPGASALAARPIARMVRSELSPAIFPTLAVMRTWRAAKAFRSLFRGPAHAAAATATPTPSHDVECSRGGRRS